MKVLSPQTTEDIAMTFLLSALAAYTTLVADPSAGGLLDRAMALLRAWRARLRERDELGQMDDRMLKDMGLTRSDAVVERDKFF
jgi:uncharacterized protein YjiS (DUF1127 family)